MNLSTAELANMRAIQDNYMPDTCVIQAVTLASDGMGGRSETWAAASTVSCRLVALGGDEQWSSDKQQVFARYQLTVPNGTTISETHRVVVNSTTFRVLHVDSAKSNNTVRRAIVERVS